MLYAIFAAVGKFIELQQIPPPPPTVLETLNPTYSKHHVEATCAPASLTLDWEYMSHGLFVAYFKFQKRSASQKQIDQINHWLIGLRGDVVLRIACGGSGAKLSFIDADRAGTPGAMQIQISWINGKPELTNMFNF